MQNEIIKKQQEYNIKIKHQQKRIFMAWQIKYYQALCKSACDSIINVDFTGT